MKICVLGAAGSGTSTISSSIAKRYGWRKFESDYFAWEQTDPPFVRQRPDKESISLLLTEITKYDDLIVAGNVASSCLRGVFIKWRWPSSLGVSSCVAGRQSRAVAVVWRVAGRVVAACHANHSNDMSNFNPSSLSSVPLPSSVLATPSD